MFKFGEFLTDKFITSGNQVSFIDIKLVYEYSKLLERIYAEVLDYITVNIINGHIIQMDKYIRHKINGEITTIIKEFIYKQNVKKTDNT